MCVVCRGQSDKKTLLRIVKNKDGNTELITVMCTAASQIIDISINDKGLPEEYTGEFKNLDWIEKLQISTSPNASVGEYILMKNAGNSIPVIKLLDPLFDTSYEMELGKYYHLDDRKYQLSIKEKIIVTV